MQPDHAPESLEDALRAVQRNDAARRPERLTLVRAADVAPVPVSWLWPDWLPFGKLVSIDGVAGVGKSTLVTDLIARATNGVPMPYAEYACPPVTVLMAGVEDGWGDTIRPRLDAAGACIDRVRFVTASQGEQFTIPGDVLELVAKAKAEGATWLHVDAIMGALDEKVNANNDPQVRRALGPLKDAAAEAGILVTFIRHPRKAGGLAVNAGGASVAFSALARVGLFVGWHPEDQEKEPEAQRRVLSVAKSNIGRHPPSLAFAVVNSQLGNGAGAIAWHGSTAVTADELASPLPSPQVRGEPIPKPDPRARERAWLLEQLGIGQRRRVDDLKALAREAGLEWHRVKRAADDEGVSKERLPTWPSPTEWYIPLVQSAHSEHSEHGDWVSEHSALCVPSVPTDGQSSVENAAGPGVEQFDWTALEDAA